MHSRRAGHRWVVIPLALVLLATIPTVALGSHSWGNYHWARTANPFTLKLGDNVSSTWDSYLATTSSDWTQSTVLNTTIVAGGSRNRNCRATSGRVEVCNASYGSNGWLGVAQIWVNGSHITQGTVKVNDTYFNTSSYNSPAWRNLVMCQEVGHTFGLDHQDENFNNANLGTCMDYTSSPGTNQHPNQGDYDQLLCIYDPAKAGQTLTTATHSCTGTGHLDSTTTVGQSVSPSAAAPGWGRLVRAGGAESLFRADLGNGQALFTFVFWAR